METIAQLQSKLQEAADLLASVTRELDAHRNAGAAAESFDFARLRCDAENHPYTGHPVTRSSIPELYYLLLLTILTSAEAKEAQWLHLYRIAQGADYAQDVHDRCADGGGHRVHSSRQSYTRIPARCDDSHAPARGGGHVPA